MSDTHFIITKRIRNKLGKQKTRFKKDLEFIHKEKKFICEQGVRMSHESILKERKIVENVLNERNVHKWISIY